MVVAPQSNTYLYHKSTIYPVLQKRNNIRRRMKFTVIHDGSQIVVLQSVEATCCHASALMHTSLVHNVGFEYANSTLISMLQCSIRARQEIYSPSRLVLVQQKFHLYTMYACGLCCVCVGRFIQRPHTILDVPAYSALGDMCITKILLRHVVW